MRTEEMNDRMRKVVGLREQGWSLRKIAAALDIGVGTVRRDLVIFERDAVEDLLAQLCAMPPAE